VKGALTHDEHVSSLAATLRKERKEAVALLVEAATRPQPPKPEPPPRPEPPIPGRKLKKEGRKTVAAGNAKQVFDEIEADLSGTSGATLEVDWKVYEKE
jgi:hypothetical protein